MVQAHRLESDTWVAVGEPLMAPDYLAWSFDANGDGLRDVGLSSFPGDPVPGIQVHVLVSDGLGGVSQFEHEFEIACGVTAFFATELTGDGIVDLACYTNESSPSDPGSRSLAPRTPCPSSSRFPSWQHELPT